MFDSVRRFLNVIPKFWYDFGKTLKLSKRARQTISAKVYGQEGNSPRLLFKVSKYSKVYHDKTKLHIHTELVGLEAAA